MQAYNVADLPHELLSSAKSGEIFSKSAILSELFSCTKLFIHHEILAPGRRDSSPHRHTTQEEVIFVLEGFPTAHIGDKAISLKPGDFLGFPLSSHELHSIANETKSDVRYLVICSKESDDKVVY